MENALMIIWSYAVPLLLSICIAHSVHKLLKIRADIAYPVGYMFFGLGTYVFVLSGITITTSYILFFTILVFTDIVFAVQGKISYRFERKDIEIAIAFIVLYLSLIHIWRLWELLSFLKVSYCISSGCLNT